jgi:hypothetical protein
MQATWAPVALLVLTTACAGERGVGDAGLGADTSVVATDASPGPGDGAADDAGGRADASPPSVDASVPGSLEDCATDVDEDANGYAGCDDPICWREERCVEEEFRERVDAAGTAPACGDPIVFDTEATTMRCLEGFPFGFESERELDCGRKSVRVTAQRYCQPDGEMRALRWIVDIDVASETEMLSADSYRVTSFTAEPVFFYVMYESGARAHGSGGIRPVHEAIVGDRYQAVDWFLMPQGTRFIVFFAVNWEELLFTDLEGGGDVTTTPGDLFLTAAFEVVL